MATTLTTSACFWNNLWSCWDDDTQRSAGLDFSKEFVYFIIQECWDQRNQAKSLDENSEDDYTRLQNMSDECEKYYDLITSIKNLPSKLSVPKKELAAIISTVPK